MWLTDKQQNKQQAKHHGFGFKAREPGKVTVEIDGKDVDFKVLHVLEFTSDRKKSSVVLRREDGSLVVRWRGVALRRRFGWV